MESKASVRGKCRFVMHDLQNIKKDGSYDVCLCPYVYLKLKTSDHVGLIYVWIFNFVFAQFSI